VPGHGAPLFGNPIREDNDDGFNAGSEDRDTGDRNSPPEGSPLEARGFPLAVRAPEERDGEESPKLSGECCWEFPGSDESPGSA